METVLTNILPINREQFNEVLMRDLKDEVDSYIQGFQVLIDQVNNLIKNNELLKIVNKDYYIETKLQIAMPDLETFPMESIDSVVDFDFESYLGRTKVIEGWSSQLPTLRQLKAKRNYLKSVMTSDEFVVCLCDESRYSTYKDLEVAYNPYTEQVTLEKAESLQGKIYVFPINNLAVGNSTDFLMYYFINFEMYPEGLVGQAITFLADLHMINSLGEKYVSYSSQKGLTIDGEKLLRKALDNPEDQWWQKLHWKIKEHLKKYYEVKTIKAELDVREKLLKCEKNRADIEPYEERILTDPNRGHWDLWSNQSDKKYSVELDEQFIARNPMCDINENGVIAIDFGTKSTIVVYQSDIEHSLPMGIGDGNLSKSPSMKRYENPTVMHFVDIDKFMKEYNASKGRPNTKWNDLTISHTAMDQFSASKSDEYYEYLHQIKQWAGQRERQFRIRSHNGSSMILPAFLDLKEDDINPIELYAYYIGLYINNMRKGHGIFLDYYLSFPVTYEVKIREKIIESFEKGLKKSLPDTILNNPEVMKRFHVNGDISEPAAYAVCALQEYGFEPEDDEEIFYGIFDFGGGTTDFDFGLWKPSNKRRYDYTIENFGAGGDEFLGGENLLAMLAFEVFKKNQEFMRENGYTFTLAPKCKEFLGSDALLSDSQEAEKNMHNLMEVLRPYWETGEDRSLRKSDPDKWLTKHIANILAKYRKDECYYDLVEDFARVREDYLESERSLEDVEEEIDAIIDNYGVSIQQENQEEELVVTLFDREGKDHVNETLSFTRKEIDTFIEDKIREGVNNFFSALLLSYQNEKVKKPTTVNILLAGNSCKSPIVTKVFNEEIEKQQKNIKEKYHIEGNVGKLFEVFPPLGTEAAYEKMEERGIPYSRDDFEKPTGKTGVAFGLLQCREGGSVERISHSTSEKEIPFQYFIGWRSRKKFVVFKDETKLTKYKGKPDYNVWYKFIEADVSIFDLYYTSLPECISGELMVDGNAAVKRQRCSIDVVDENAFVYIRAVDPHTIEYVVAKEDNVEGSMLGEITRKELG